MGRGSNGIISLSSGDIGGSDQGHLHEYRVSVRDSAKVTMEN